MIKRRRGPKSGADRVAESEPDYDLAESDAGILRYESSTLEFKREIPGRDALLATLCAMANTAGGELWIGVDNNGRPVGMDEKSILASEEMISSWIAQGIKPMLIPLIRAQSTDQGPILIIKVGSGSNRPFARISHGTETVFVRIGSSTRQADSATVERLQLQARGLHWDSLPTLNAKEKDLDPDLIREYWRYREHARGIPAPKSSAREWLLKNRFLVNEGGRFHPTHAGVLFFHAHPQIVLQQSAVECARFPHADTRDFLDKLSLTGPIWKMPDLAENFLMRHMPVRVARQSEETPSSFQRKEKLAYPAAALREFFLNALIHRAYEGYEVRVIHLAIFDDVIELTNPGSLPEGLELKDLGSGLSTLRNPTIARAFSELGMIERWGTGIMIAQNRIKEAGLPPARFQLKGFFFQITSTWRWSATLDDVEQKVLSLATHRGTITSTEIAGLVGLTDRSVRRILVDLVNRGYLIKIGTTRDSAYKLR